jgi:hypothetical protein
MTPVDDRSLALGYQYPLHGFGTRDVQTVHSCIRMPHDRSSKSSEDRQRDVLNSALVLLSADFSMTTLTELRHNQNRCVAMQLDNCGS